MQSRRQLLAVVRPMVVFEAAGRHGSFTAAGRELGMSQAAVSYAVQALERQLGVALFRRRHRRVELTAAGERFHADVTLGLGHIRKSAEQLTASIGRNHVTLSVSTAFATLWMAPRLARARAALPGIDLRLHASDRDLDIVAEGFPLGVRGGDPALWPDYASAPLAREEIVAVAAPEWLERHGPIAQPADLPPGALIHLDEPHRPAARWEDWLKSAGVSLRPLAGGFRANEYVTVVQAALDGEGVALGWLHLVEGLIAAGRLVPVTRHRLDTGQFFHVVWPRAHALSENAERVRDWLLSEA
jgi:DNA-binding transcriptional LysR family regulator